MCFCSRKRFPCTTCIQLIGQYISGTTASGLYGGAPWQGRNGKGNHVFAPAYKAEDMKELSETSDHIILTPLRSTKSTGKRQEKRVSGSV